MNRELVLLSGPLCSGKTTLGRRLSEARGDSMLSVRETIARVAGDELLTRAELQKFGEGLEARNPGRWLAEAVADRFAEGVSSIVVDALRTAAQVNEIRAANPMALIVHLTATVEARAHRYVTRQPDIDGEPASYLEAMNSPIEEHADELSALADLVVDTTFLGPDEVLRDTLKFLAQRSP